MKNGFNAEEFKLLKRQTEESYKKTISINSPALKATIFFNSNGWHHLRYDNNRSERDKIVQKNKLMFFDDAVTIIKRSSTIQEYRRNVFFLEETKELKITEFFAFWAIISFKKNIRIKVIVRRIGGNDGKFHFWSVMPFWQLNKNGRTTSSENIENE